MLKDLDCIVVQHFEEVVQHLEGPELLPFSPNIPLNSQVSSNSGSPQKDFLHVIVHEQAKRALEIAAAGEHNVLMDGPPGCDKSLLA